MLKRLLSFYPFVTMMLSFWGGGRHDVPESRYIELAKHPDFDCVGLIRIEGKPSASCVLVDSNWILTAGHVVAGRNSITVQFNNKQFAVDMVLMHPAYEKGKLGHNVDLALLKLKTGIRETANAKINTGKNEIGEVGTIVGYGSWGRGKEIITRPSAVGTMHAGQNMIDQSGGMVGPRQFKDNLLIADFDHPDSAGFNKIGSAVALELEYCPVGGDSGGGLFIKRDGEYLLAGILTAYTPQVNDNIENGLYGSLMYWIKVRNYKDWIIKTFETN